MDQRDDGQTRGTVKELVECRKLCIRMHSPANGCRGPEVPWAPNSKGVPPVFSAGDYVLVARSRKITKLTGTRTGPRRVVMQSGHVYAEEYPVTGTTGNECREDVPSFRHVSLDVMEELKEMVAKTHDEEELQMPDALNSRQLDDDRYDVLCQ